MATGMWGFRASALPEKGLVKGELLIEGLKETCRPCSAPCGALPVALAGRPFRLLLRRRQPSGGFGDLAGTDACRAHAQGFAGAVNNRMNALEIWIPPSAGDVVSVAHVVSVGRTFAANFASTRHQKLL
jgi:hypothetical protein